MCNAATDEEMEEFIIKSVEIDLELPTKQQSQKLKKVELTHCDKYQSFLKKHCYKGLYVFQVLILEILNKFSINKFLIHVTHLLLQALRMVIYPSYKNWTKEHPFKSLFLLLSFIYSLLTVMELIYRFQKYFFFPSYRYVGVIPFGNQQFKLMPFPVFDPDNTWHNKQFSDVIEQEPTEKRYSFQHK